MKSLKMNIPIILLILFEVAVGILLFTNPEAFTRTVIILFGVVLLSIGITYLVRHLREKKEGVKHLSSLIISVVSLIAGAIFAFCSGLIIGFITAIAIIYGVILLISGIYKLHSYFQIKKAKIPVSKAGIVSGAAAIILGLIIVIYPKDAAFSVWQAAGVMLLAEAAIDFISIIQVVRNKG